MFGTAPVPFGRRADVLAGLPDPETLAWQSAGRGWDAGDYLVRFASRTALVEAFRKQKATRTVMQPRKLSPVVPTEASIEGKGK